MTQNLSFKNLLGATALSAMILPSVAIAGTYKMSGMETEKESDRISLFQQLDLNDDNLLSKDELMSYHDSAVTPSVANDYSYIKGQSSDALNGYFGTLDDNDDGMLTEAEFQTMTNDIRNLFRGPTYYTVTYYTTVHEINADELEGRTVENLDGDSIGRIEGIAKMKDSGELFAWIDLDGSPFYRLTRMQPDTVGIKLDDLLFIGEEGSFAMTTKGENEIRDMEMTEIDDDAYEDVDTLYTSSM